MSDQRNLYEDVDQLRKALTKKNMEKEDEETLIKITAKNNLKQRLNIISQYKTTWGTDLLDDLKSHISADFLDLMIGLYMNKYEYDAEQCHKSIEGLGTNEDTLIEILGTRPGWMLKKIMMEYKKKFKAELKEEVNGDTSGDFRDLLLLLLKCNRSENKNPDKEKCKKIAIEIFNKDEKKLKTDVFNKYFEISSPAELMIIAREYEIESHSPLMKDIEDNFSGDASKLIKTVFKANISPSEYFATRIDYSLRGSGTKETKEKILNRIIVTRNEIDIPLIKKYYEKLYSKDLVEDIKEDTSGSYQNLLVAMLNK